MTPSSVARSGPNDGENRGRLGNTGKHIDFATVQADQEEPATSKRRHLGVSKCAVDQDRSPVFGVAFGNDLQNIVFADVMDQRHVLDFPLNRAGQHAAECLSGGPALRDLARFPE